MANSSHSSLPRIFSLWSCFTPFSVSLLSPPLHGISYLADINASVFFIICSVTDCQAQLLLTANTAQLDLLRKTHTQWYLSQRAFPQQNGELSGPLRCVQNYCPIFEMTLLSKSAKFTSNVFSTYSSQCLNFVVKLKMCNISH